VSLFASDKRKWVASSRMQSLLAALKKNGHFWPHFGQMWSNTSLIRILGEDDFTNLL